MTSLLRINRRVSLMFLVAMAVVFSGLAISQAVAQTPDGETPANEGVCDGLQGATPGLFGLCNAYCEAQDLDDFEKEPPRTKILANYRKKMKAGDPDMPCIQAPCACVSQDELNEMTADGIAECNQLSGQIRIEDNVVGIHFANTDTAAGRERCTYVKATGGSPTVRVMTLTQEEAQACYTAIANSCAAVGE